MRERMTTVILGCGSSGAVSCVAVCGRYGYYSRRFDVRDIESSWKFFYFPSSPSSCHSSYRCGNECSRAYYAAALHE